jgi:hypothetical protein
LAYSLSQVYLQGHLAANARTTPITGGSFMYLVLLMSRRPIDKGLDPLVAGVRRLVAEEAL